MAPGPALQFLPHPVLPQSVNILLRTKGVEFARHCDSCHNPVAVLAGALDTNYAGDRSFDSRWRYLHGLPLDPERGFKVGKRRICHGRAFGHGR